MRYDNHMKCKPQARSVSLPNYSDWKLGIVAYVWEFCWSIRRIVNHSRLRMGTTLCGVLEMEGGRYLLFSIRMHVYIPYVTFGPCGLAVCASGTDSRRSGDDFYESVGKRWCFFFCTGILNDDTIEIKIDCLWTALLDFSSEFYFWFSFW